MQSQLQQDIDKVTKLIQKFNSTSSNLDKRAIYLESSTQLTALNKHLRDFEFELRVNNVADKSELVSYQSKVNDLRTQYFNIQEYVERHAKFQEAAKATGDVTDLLESGKKIQDTIRLVHETNGIMKGANEELLRQKDVIDDLYDYDARINVFVDRATGKVAAIERAMFLKKILLLSLAGSLGLMLFLVIILKIF